MRYTMTKLAASMALLISSGSAHAVLTSYNTLSIQGDALTSLVKTNTTMYWTETGNGPMLDSFFTMGGRKDKFALGTQYSYLYNGADLTLSGTPQSNIATWGYYESPGSNKTTGTGISILSASGDTASVDMSGYTFEWNGVENIPLGDLAWSTGYTSGVGNITCEAGSGCTTGSSYTLKYTATFRSSDSSYIDPVGFGGVKYYLELHGTVGAVPEASTYSMMLAGLSIVGFIVRRRKVTRVC